MKSGYFIILILLAVLFCFPAISRAESSGVSLSAEVVAPGTKNDFDLSKVNPDATQPDDQGSVKGASTSAKKDNSVPIIAFELGAVAIAALFVIVLKKKHRTPSNIE